MGHGFNSYVTNYQRVSEPNPPGDFASGSRSLKRRSASTRKTGACGAAWPNAEENGEFSGSSLTPINHNMSWWCVSKDFSYFFSVWHSHSHHIMSAGKCTHCIKIGCFPKSDSLWMSKINQWHRKNATHGLPPAIPRLKAMVDYHDDHYPKSGG